MIMSDKKYFYCLLVLFLVTCFLVKARETSEMSKRSLMESLAKTFTEPQVFYRWQSEAARNNLLREGELTSKTFQYFAEQSKKDAAGSGMYISGNIYSSQNYGDTLIEVEIKSGTRYLDLTDPETLKTLRTQGIDPWELKEIDPKLVLKYEKGSDWWVVKNPEGVSFKPFSAQHMPLDDLAGINWSQKKVDMAAIRPALRERIKKEGRSYFDFPLSLIEEDFKNIDNIRLGDMSLMKGSKLLEEVSNRLNLTEEVKNKLSSKVANQVASYNIKTVDGVGAFLRQYAKYLPPEETLSFVSQKLPSVIQSSVFVPHLDSTELWINFEKTLPPSIAKQAQDAVLDLILLRLDSAEKKEKMLAQASHLSDDQREKIKSYDGKKVPVTVSSPRLNCLKSQLQELL